MFLYKYQAILNIIFVLHSTGLPSLTCFTFNEFTELDCRAFSLFETVASSLISQVLSDVMLCDVMHERGKTKIIFRIA